MEGAIYLFRNELLKIYFANPDAQLPIRLKSGELVLATWGRRVTDEGSLPFGCCVLYDDLKQGSFDKFFPKPVKVMVNEYKLTSADGLKSEWFSLTRNQYIHGVIAREGKEQRLYIITVKTSLETPYATVPRTLFD
jgi:hypothetical protein